jgi:hypothetical protein
MKQHEINRHKEICNQLGMPIGTATGRLRKLVLFGLLKRHNENVCYRCKKDIGTAEELSMEHMQPWWNANPDLFWDLGNIAFSHLLCNTLAARRPHAGQPSPRRTESPEGMNWCRTHKQFLPVENFSKRPERWNGLKYDCKECEKKYKDFHRYGEV